MQICSLHGNYYRFFGCIKKKLFILKEKERFFLSGVKCFSKAVEIFELKVHIL